MPYSWWYLLLCLLCGLAYAILLYHRSGEDSSWTRRVKAGMFALRTLSVALICVLLLSPILKHFSFETSRPKIYIGIDQSQSVGFAIKDKVGLLENIKALQSALAKKFDVETYSLSDQILPKLNDQFNGQATNLNQFFQQINESGPQAGNGAVILLSDGIFNQGPSPLFEAARSGRPIYTIAVGDTMPARDLSILNVAHNEIGYLGDKTTIQVDLQAFNYAGKSAVVTLAKINGDKQTVLTSKAVNIAGNSFFQTVTLPLTLSAVGNQKYIVTVTHLDGESTYENNLKIFYHEVLDSKLNIDLIAAGPHPDIAALKAAISQDKNYDLKVHFLMDPIRLHDKSDLVICYQVPTDNTFAPAFEQIWQTVVTRKIPRLFIIGGQTNVPRLNSIQKSVAISQTNGSLTDAYPMEGSSFTYFNIPSEWKTSWQTYPPLQVPFGAYQVSPGMEVMLRQRIGKVETQFPLWLMGWQDDVKTGIITGEGLWRWRMQEAKGGLNNTHFDALMGATLRFLSTKDDKRKFRVRSDETNYTETDHVNFSGELYNNNYEPISSAEINLKVKDQKGKSYDYQLGRYENNYTVDAGTFPQGDYTYTATSRYNGVNYSAEGKFSVSPVQKELFDLVADYGLLSQLAVQSGGKMITLAQIGDLAKMITADDSIKPVIKKNFKADPLINFKWIFAVLIGLLGLEWFMRRYAGRY